MNKQIIAAVMAVQAAVAAALLTAGCTSQNPPASPRASPAPANATKASTAASSPACTSRLSAWRSAGERFDHTLLHVADAAESHLRSLITQAEDGAEPSIGAALTDSGALASTAKQMLDHHLPPSCAPQMRAALTASMLNFEKQAADMNDASLALNDWNAQGAERLLKAASHDIAAGASGISQATADSKNYRS